MIIFETVSRSTPLTEGVTAAEAAAPAKSRLQEMIREVQEKVKAKAETKAKAKEDIAQVTQAAPAANSGKPMTITFGGLR
ncbi:MAG: hypothetical protein II830_03515 [Alphaproteobacteria bacterium]|nr:hypothetical protein [Alphaproteobacteria bacterium]